MTIENSYQRENIFNEIKQKIISLPKLYNKAGQINSNLYKMISVDDINIINRLFPELTLSQAVYCFINNIVNLPICKICNINHVTYFRNHTDGFTEYCSLQCSRRSEVSKKRRAETNMQRYGFTNPKQNAQIIEKTKKTNLEKYGTNCASQQLAIKEKISNTLKQTYIERGNEIIAAKNNTFDKKYGTHPNRLEITKEKKKQRTLKKYGVEHTTQLETTKAKNKETLRQKYGVDSFSKTPMFLQLHKLRNQQLTELSNDTFLKLIDGINTASLTRDELANLINIPISTSNVKLRKLNIPIKECSIDRVSNIELEIVAFLKSIGITNIESNNRTILNGKELDIFLPDYNLAIEVNGIYWHTEKFGKDSKYHLNKTEQCLTQQIQLLHIFDFEWNNQTKQEIWKGMINSRLKLNTRIPARKCQVAEVPIQDSINFCNKYHLQGYIGGSLKLGLYYKNELMQLIIVGKSRYNKNY